MIRIGSSDSAQLWVLRNEHHVLPLFGYRLRHC